MYRAHPDKSAVIRINLSKLPPQLVILSATKDLTHRAEILRCTQDDSSSPDCRA